MDGWRRHDIVRYGPTLAMAVGLSLIMGKYEQSNCRRQIPVLTPPIDDGDQIRQCLSAENGDFLECFPKGIFEANAGLMTSDDNRALFDERSHCPNSLSAPALSSQGCGIS